jgi:hypothetical protein
MSPTRWSAAAFGASHVLVSAVGAAAPAAFGRPWLGEGSGEPAARAAIRGFALCDGIVAALVVDGALRDASLRSRLRFGAASDVSRALAALSGRGAAAPAVVAASLAGATLATLLSRSA